MLSTSTARLAENLDFLCGLHAERSRRSLLVNYGVSLLFVCFCMLFDAICYKNIYC